jgi:hypothetical protein
VLVLVYTQSSAGGLVLRSARLLSLSEQGGRLLPRRGRPRQIMAKESIIESESVALETIKELFKVGATFGCQKLLDEQGQSKGRLIIIFDEGRGYADDSSGEPSDYVNKDLLGRVLVAREADMRQRQAEESEAN